MGKRLNLASGFSSAGFMEIVGLEGYTPAKQLAQSTLLWDIGAYALNSGKLYSDMEYIDWHNKLEVEGITESNPQLELRWVF